MLNFSNSFKTFASMAALAAIAFVPGTAAAQGGNAQGRNTQDAPTQQAVPNANFSDAKLEAFINTANKIQAIQQDMLPKLKQAQNAEQQESIKEKIRGEMVNTIQESNNITVPEFQKISVQSRNDNQLAQRISTIARNMQN